MTTSAPQPVSSLSSLGRAVQIGGWEVFVRRLTPAGLFRLTLLENNDESSEGEFFLENGVVRLMFVSPGLVRAYNGRDNLKAALQRALALAAVRTARADMESTRAAYLARRSLQTVRAFNAAWQRWQEARAALKAL